MYFWSFLRNFFFFRNLFDPELLIRKNIRVANVSFGACAHRSVLLVEFLPVSSFPFLLPSSLSQLMKMGWTVWTMSEDLTSPSFPTRPVAVNEDSVMMTSSQLVSEVITVGQKTNTHSFGANHNNIDFKDAPPPSHSHLFTSLLHWFVIY